MVSTLCVFWSSSLPWNHRAFLCRVLKTLCVCFTLNFMCLHWFWREADSSPAKPVETRGHTATSSRLLPPTASTWTEGDMKKGRIRQGRQRWGLMFSMSGVQSSSKRGHLSIDHVDSEGTRHLSLEEKHISAKHRESGNALHSEVLREFRDGEAADTIRLCAGARGEDSRTLVHFHSLVPFRLAPSLPD